MRNLGIIAIMLAAMLAGPQAAEAKIHHYLFGTYADGIYPTAKKVFHKKYCKHVKLVKHLKAKHHFVKKKMTMKAKPAALLTTKVVTWPAYQDRELVQFASKENPGTIFINTKQRSLY